MDLDQQPAVCPCGARCIEFDRNWILSEKVIKKSTRPPVHKVVRLDEAWNEPNTKPLKLKYINSRSDSGLSSSVSDADSDKQNDNLSERSNLGDRTSQSGSHVDRTSQSGNHSIDDDEEEAESLEQGCDQSARTTDELSVEDDVTIEITSDDDEARDKIGLFGDIYPREGLRRRPDRMFFQPAQWWCNIGERYALDLYYPIGKSNKRTTEINHKKEPPVAQTAPDRYSADHELQLHENHEHSPHQPRISEPLIKTACHGDRKQIASEQKVVNQYVSMKLQADEQRATDGTRSELNEKKETGLLDSHQTYDQFIDFEFGKAIVSANNSEDRCIGDNGCSLTSNPRFKESIMALDELTEIRSPKFSSDSKKDDTAADNLNSVDNKVVEVVNGSDITGAGEEQSRKDSCGSDILLATENATPSRHELTVPSTSKYSHQKRGSHPENNKDGKRRQSAAQHVLSVASRIIGSKRNSEVEEDEEAKWLNWVKKQFEIIAGEDQAIDLQEFKTALKVKKSFFAERFFALFDTDKSGTIDLPELMEGLEKLTKGSPREKLKFLFDVYDVDGSGTIDPEELETVLRSCMEESSMQLSDDAIKSLTMALFKSADEDDSGEITFDELVNELERHPGVMENLTISAAQWLKPPEDNPPPKKPRLIGHYCNRAYLQNNMKKVVFFFVFLFITAVHFITSAIMYRKFNYCVIIARGFGMALNFNCTFIVILMLRTCLSWLRTTRVGSYLPIDQNIMFHKLTGYMIAICTLGHTVAHLGNIAIVLSASDEDMSYDNTTITPSPKLEFWEYLFTLRSGVGYVGPGFAYLSGVLLDIILVIIVVCSMGFVRRGGHFQVFYWTHMLFVVFWLLLILHAPRFLYFFVFPGFVYFLERIYRSKMMKLYKYGKMYVTEVHLLPSKVTHLVIDKPEQLRFKPGDYVFLNIPAIAHQEWHPFTISSAPELEGKFWVHIRTAGHWTSKVFDYFEQLPELGTNGFDNIAFDAMEAGRLGMKEGDYKLKQSADRNREKKRAANDSRAKTVKVQVFIDGPYGTPTREIFETEHAVLVGSGIGVTPFAAILQSVMYRYKASKVTCPHCARHWYGEIPKSVMKLRKVDFIWINRDQKSFEWFIRLLAQLELQQADASSENFLQMQMYMTSAISKNDMKGLGLQMALEILHKQEKKDALTGLKTRTQAGRPDWDKVFNDVAKDRRGKVKMFFCGSPRLAKELKQHCMRHGFSFSQEHF